MEIVSYSANFDDDTFTLLMQRLAVRWPHILTASRISEMSAFCHSLERDEYRPFSLAVEYAGEITSFGIVAYDGGAGFLELDFFSFSELIASIEQEHQRLCAEQNIPAAGTPRCVCV